MEKVFLLLVSCVFALNIQAQTVSTSGVVLNHDTIIMAVGQDTTLVANVLPSNATDKVVTWEILEGNSFVDTVYTLQDTICKIEALSVGTAKIVVKTHDANFRDTCVIHVIIPVTDISLSDDTIQMFLDTESLLIATVSPFEATDKSIDWIINDQAVAEIEIIDDSTCNVKALTVGETLIFAVASNGDIKDSCVIEVSYRPIESLILNTNSIDMYIGEDAFLTAYLEPKSGINTEVNWYALNPAIVDVVSAGRDTIYQIHAKAVGEGKIAVVSIQDPLMTDTCVVTVHGIPAEGMSLDHDTLVMNVNTDTILVAGIFPFNTTDKSIEWTSTDSAIVDIISTPLDINDTICVIRAIKSDTTKIVAKTLDGGFLDTCVVIVIVPADSLVMSIDSVTMDIDDIYELRAILYPDSATFKTLQWTISDPTIVDTLYTEDDSIAHIQALKAGISYVYATTADGLIQDSCVVTVNILPVSGVKISVDSLDLVLYDEFELTATILPAKASDQTVVWTSSDLTIVDILSTGNDTICVIKGLQFDQEAIIYVTTNDGDIQDSCVVTVLPFPITGLELTQDSMTCYLDNDVFTHTYYLEANIQPYQLVHRDIEWTSSDPAVVDIISMSHDTIVQLSPLSLGTAIIYARALDGDFKDSCFVTVKDQFFVLETDTATTTIDGIIEVSLIVPDNEILAGSFELHLPKGFGLAKDGNGFKSSLTTDFDDDYTLKITYINDSVYHFDISSDVTTSSRIKPRTGVALLNLMDIAYTIYEDALFGSNSDYLAKFVDIVFELDDDMTLEDERVDVVIKVFRDPTGNVVIIKPALISYIHTNRLYVNSEQAETIYVYSLNGQLLFSARKNEGPAVFNLQIPEKTLIVRGSSGWTNKVANP